MTELLIFLVEVEEKKAPQTPKSNSRPSTATPKSTTGKKRSREEIEANKLERERKYVYKNKLVRTEKFYKISGKKKKKKRRNSENLPGLKHCKNENSKRNKKRKKNKK